MTVLGFVILGFVAFVVGRRKIDEAANRAEHAAREAAASAAASWREAAEGEQARRTQAEIEAAATKARLDAVERERAELAARTDLSPLLKQLAAKWADHSEEHAGILTAIERVVDRLDEDAHARSEQEDRLAHVLERMETVLDRLTPATRPPSPAGSKHPLERAGEPQHAPRPDLGGVG